MLCKDTTGLMSCSSTEPMTLLRRINHSEVFDFPTIPLSHNNCLKEKRNYCAFAAQVQACNTVSPTSQRQFHFSHVCTRTNTTSFWLYSLLPAMVCQCSANQWNRDVAQPVLAGHRLGTGTDCACFQQVFTHCNPDYHWNAWWKWSQQKRGDFRGVKQFRICAKICAFYGNNDGISKNRRYFEKPVFFPLLVGAILSLRKASTSPGADWYE